jgi:type I restriction enzyme S subunit
MDLACVYDNYKFNDYFKTNLPEHWLEKRLGYLVKEERAAFVDGPFGSDLKSSDYKDSGVPLIQLNNIRDSKHLMQNMKFVTEDKKQQLIRHLAKPGDVVIAKMADPVARSAVVADDFSEYIIVADCVKMTPNLELTNLNYLVWAINCDFVRINAELVSTGTTRVRINLGELKKLKIPYPPYIEQQKIANFLDHETAKIDSLIDKQQKLITLLKEKRQAVISHAVTKGINPNAPMRDSGVEWLGEVPVHWECSSVKNLCYINDGNHGEEYPTEADFVYDGEGVPFIRAGDFDEFRIVDRDLRYISHKKNDSMRKGRLQENDILFVNRGATIGKLCIIDSKYAGANLNSQIAYIRADKSLADHRYLTYFLSSTYIHTKILAAIQGGALPQYPLKHIVSLDVWHGKTDEQTLIADFLDEQIRKIALLIYQCESAIKLMQERRTALISAAVTGKIDVRNWVAPAASNNHKEVAT